MRRFLIANTAWEGTFAGARTFVVLYITVGLGQPLGTSTAVLAAVAGGYVVAALGSGVARRPARARAGDRAVASVVYGVGLLAAAASRNEWHALVPAAHLRRRDRGRDGDDAGLGPALQADAAGRPGRDLRARDDDEGDRPAHRPAARRRGDRPPRPPRSSDTSGYQVLWPILGVPILLAIPLVWPLSAAERDVGPGEPEGPEPIAEDVERGDGVAPGERQHGVAAAAASAAARRGR